MKYRSAFLTMIVLLFVFSVPVMLTAQDQTSPAPLGERPDAPPYALHGPYWVGTQTLEFDSGTENAHRFTIWYPALNPDGLAEDTTYIMSDNHFLRSMLPPEEPFTVLGHALENALPDTSGAPYPLVINSHGFTAQMWQVYLGEHLASYGFVVIAPEHANDSWDNVYTDVVTRMFEVTRAINDAQVMSAEGGILAGMIDTEHIAVGGHSAGGMDSYGAGGALLNWSEVEAYCAEVPEDPGCADLEAQHQDVIAMLGTEIGADGLQPVIWDSRVDALFPMAGSIEMHGEAGLASITIPIMTLFGSADPAYNWLYPAYGYVSSEQKAQVVFENGAHGLFYNQCKAFPYILDYDLYWACSDSVWDSARSQDLINHFVTAFLLDTLKGDTDAHNALSPDAVDFPGITYQAQGF